MIVAAAAAEVEVMQAEYDASYAEYEAYCAQNPWDCEEWARPSGPSACGPSCAGQAVQAVASIAAAGATAYLVGEGPPERLEGRTQRKIGRTSAARRST